MHSNMLAAQFAYQVKTQSTDDWTAFNAKLTDKVPTLLNLSSDETEARDAMYARLGRPDTRDGYKVEGADPDFLSGHMTMAYLMPRLKPGKRILKLKQPRR